MDIVWNKRDDDDDDDGNDAMSLHKTSNADLTLIR